MILIISPNFELKYCGVSDYVLVLSKLLEKNNDVQILALSDIYIKNIEENENHLRIPYSFKSNIKIKIALDFIQKYKPKKIIFNLVSYGYQKKGFPFYLIELFQKIGIEIDVIAHELWMGNFKNESFKNKILGFFQKKLLVKLLRFPNVKKIFVTTDISKNILNSLEIKASTLPVFSNIPICVKSKPDFLESNTFRFILFGSIAFQVDTTAFVEIIIKQFLNKGKNVIISHVGVYRGYIEEWELAKSKLVKHGAKFQEYGIIEANEISTLFQIADFGLTSYMPEFWSKSGTIAAMLAHGLPVISISKYDHIHSFNNQLNLNSRMIHINNINEDSDLSSINKLPQNEFYNEKIFEENLT